MTWFTSCSLPELPLSKVHVRVSFSADAGRALNAIKAPITPVTILIRVIKLRPFYPGHAAAARSSLSPPRMTITSASSGMTKKTRSDRLAIDFWRPALQPSV